MNAKDQVHEDYKKIFATRLKMLMKNKNGISPLKKRVTQDELAKVMTENYIPIKRQTISMYIHEKSTPDLGKFKFIADYFKVPYDYLLGQTENVYRENIDITEKTGLSDKAINLLAGWKKIMVDSQNEFDGNINDSRSNEAFSRIFNVMDLIISSQSILYYAVAVVTYVNGIKELECRKREIDNILKNTDKQDQIRDDSQYEETVLMLEKYDIDEKFMFEQWRLLETIKGKSLDIAGVLIKEMDKQEKEKD